ncbi:MAG: DUF3850 domain-containing protein [Lachnospiraceae bacterium]|jgi:hypothetical protein|nr:DUF3850 domain-containing protein [Lachnospiraceae bacterium]
MVHNLKVKPEYFKELKLGRKTFEIRKDDRPYAEGDVLLLREWDDHLGFTGSVVTAKAGYILRNAECFGLDQDYCIISLFYSVPWEAKYLDEE